MEKNPGTSEFTRLDEAEAEVALLRQLAAAGQIEEARSIVLGWRRAGRNDDLAEGIAQAARLRTEDLDALRTAAKKRLLEEAMAEVSRGQATTPVAESDTDALRARTPRSPPSRRMATVLTLALAALGGYALAYLQSRNRGSESPESPAESSPTRPESSGEASRRVEAGGSEPSATASPVWMDPGRAPEESTIRTPDDAIAAQIMRLLRQLEAMRPGHPLVVALSRSGEPATRHAEAAAPAPPPTRADWERRWSTAEECVSRNDLRGALLTYQAIAGDGPTDLRRKAADRFHALVQKVAADRVARFRRAQHR